MFYGGFHWFKLKFVGVHFTTRGQGLEESLQALQEADAEDEGF